MDFIKITQHMIGHHHTQMCLANKSEDKAHHANKALKWWEIERQLLQTHGENSDGTSN